MVAVSKTGDRLGLSTKSKAMFAAAVVKSAAKKGRKVRLTTEETSMSEYIPPSQAVLHFDGKLLKLKGGHKGDFICVYISGK